MIYISDIDAGLNNNYFSSIFAENTMIDNLAVKDEDRQNFRRFL